MSRESSKKRDCKRNTMMEEAERQSLLHSLCTQKNVEFIKGLFYPSSPALPNYFTCKTLSKYPLIAAPFKPHFRWLTSLKSLFTHSRAISSLCRDASGLKMRSDVFHSTLVVGQQSAFTLRLHPSTTTWDCQLLWELPLPGIYKGASGDGGGGANFNFENDFPTVKTLWCMVDSKANSQAALQGVLFKL